MNSDNKTLPIPFYKPIFFVLLLCFSVLLSTAQEKLIYYGNTNVNGQNPAKHLKGKSLILPFLDDFSKNSIYPNSTFWQDNFAYINRSLGVNPPTIGVATFDCINNKGAIYSQAGYKTVFVADYLTSQAIDLSEYTNDTTLYLSFYYQPQGLADAPEAGDSLMLDFYSPLTGKWARKWSAPGDTLQDFKFVMLKISEDIYKKDGFQFRFGNKATLSGSLKPSMATNADQWHIDYVYLNKDRHYDDTVMHDVAFVNPLGSLLKNYESVPWKHYKKLASPNFTPYYDILIRNNDNKDRNINYFKLLFRDTITNQKDSIDASHYNINAKTTTTYKIPLSFSIPKNPGDSTVIEVRAVIKTDGFDEASNNENIYYQVFKNYYAYDDGSAEAGYGLTGEGTSNAMVANKFGIFQADTLQAVDIYFGQSLNNAGRKTMFLTIWDYDKGQPGAIRWQSEGVLPEYESELNKFHRYFLDTAIVLRDTFFIGWEQAGTEFLNVGFDLNRISNGKLFTNINNTWVKSSFDSVGVLMLRPVFGKPHVKKTRKSSQAEFEVFQNQAEGITIKAIENIETNEQLPCRVYLFDISGRMIAQDNFSGQEKILTTGKLPTGIYLLRITDNYFINKTYKLFIKH
jgi:hypothetical protein